MQPIKTQRPKRSYYDEEQTRIFVENLEKLTGNDMKYLVAILLDIFTGERIVELAVLEWTDINLKNRIITINKSSQYLSSNGTSTKAPKIESSVRDVAVPDLIVYSL